jgi:hypothetical protein
MVTVADNVTYTVTRSVANIVMNGVANIVMNGVTNIVMDVVLKRKAAQRSLQLNHPSSHWRRTCQQHRVLPSRREGIRKKRSGLAMLLGLLMAASGAQAAPQEFVDQEVREVAASGSAGSVPGIYIATANTERSLDGCGTQFFIGAANPLLNQSLAIALSALYTKNHVRIEVDGCQGDDAMRIKGIRVVR